MAMRYRDAMTIAIAEYEELGLEAPRCAATTQRGRRCSQPPFDADTDRCAFHGGANVQLARNITEYRKHIQDNVIPAAIERLMNIVLDDEASHQDVIRAAFGLMDRVGMGPVSGLQIDASVQVDSPLLAIKGLLTRVAERLPSEPDIIEAEVVVGESEGPPF